MGLPDAPEVHINYLEEVTYQKFSSIYEYSFNGISWIDGNGSVIELNPGTVGKHLWVRVKETENNYSGNIRKVYVPAYPYITSEVDVKTKNGIYYIEGLEGKYYYSLSSSKEEVTNEELFFIAKTGEIVEISGKLGMTYLNIRKAATLESFTSETRSILIEQPKVLVITNDSIEGTVTGAGEYFADEIVTVTAEAAKGYEFTGWYDGEELLSEELSYSFEIWEDTTIEARFEKITEVAVIFKGWNARQLRKDIYSVELEDSSQIQIPIVPIPDGYNFAGWELDATVYAGESIAEAVREKLINCEEISVQAKFEQKPELYKVEVVNGVLRSGESEAEFKPSTVVIVGANEPESGKKFAYWLKDGVIAGYEERFGFRMPSKDTTLVAVYEDEEIPVEVRGTSYMESVTCDEANNRMIFVAINTVPTGCSIEYAGIVATSDASKATNGAELTAENADYVRGGGEGYRSYKLTWRKNNVTADQTWYVRSYLKYVDSDDNVYEIYGDLVVKAMRTKVSYIGWNGALLDEREYDYTLTDGSVIYVPTVPTPVGYMFKAWNLNGTEYTVDEIQKAILEALSKRQALSVKAVFVQKADTYNLSVVNGTILGEGSTGEYRESDLISVIADEAEEGKKFIYWQKGNVIVGYEEQYTFRMPSEDTVLTAVYENELTEVTAVGCTYIESVTSDVENASLIFVSINSVPSDCEIEYAGIVATSDASKATNGTTLTVEMRIIFVVEVLVVFHTK